MQYIKFSLMKLTILVYLKNSCFNLIQDRHLLSTIMLANQNQETLWFAISKNWKINPNPSGLVKKNRITWSWMVLRCWWLMAGVLKRHTWQIHLQQHQALCLSVELDKKNEVNVLLSPGWCIFDSGRSETLFWDLFETLSLTMLKLKTRSALSLNSHV